MYKIWKHDDANGLKHALLMLFGSICAINVWAIWVMITVRYVRLNVIMGYLFGISLQTYATEKVDKELSK